MSPCTRTVLRTPAQVRAVAVAARQRKERARQTALKAAMVARGLCRQCGKKRGQSASVSRCQRCLDKDKKAQRKKTKAQPYREGGPGRKPLSLLTPAMRQEFDAQRHDLNTAMWEAVNGPTPKAD